jgi:hypothetical protein
MAYRNPTRRTMNDAPSRDPVSMVNVCSSLVAAAANSVRAAAATGDPDSTR